MRLNDSRQQQSSLDSRIRQVDGNWADLQKQVNKIALVNQAMYELVRERTGITDEELRRKIREVDQRDGSEDGHINASPLRCPKCGGTVTSGALSCPTCGATVAPKYPYEP